MLMLVLAALQDPSWAANAHAAGRESGVRFAERMTGAEEFTCFEIMERLGQASQTAERLQTRVEMLDAAIADEERMDRGANVEEMRRQALRIARTYRSDLQQLQTENARDTHALGSVMVTFCRPIQPTP